MEVTVTIGADGTAEMNMGGEVDVAQCMMNDGALVVDTMTGTLQDGELVLSDDGVLIRMNREKPETDVSVSAMNENATIDDFIGVWTLVRVTTDGMTLPAEAAEMAGDTLTIYGDTCDLTMQGMTLDGLPCRMEGYSLLVFHHRGRCFHHASRGWNAHP